MTENHTPDVMIERRYCCGRQLLDSEEALLLQVGDDDKLVCGGCVTGVDANLMDPQDLDALGVEWPRGLRELARELDRLEK